MEGLNFWQILAEVLFEKALKSFLQNSATNRIKVGLIKSF